MPRLQPNEKRLFLSFKRDDDLALLERLEQDAAKQRYPIQTYLMLVLHAAYPPPVSSTEPGSPLEMPQ